MSAKELKVRFPDVFVGSNLIRVCRLCQKELGFPPEKFYELGWEITHGTCNRHFVYTLKLAKVPDADIEAFVSSVQKKHKLNGTTSARDFVNNGDPELLKWFQSPTPYKSSEI